MTLSPDTSRITLHPENCTGCLTCQIRCSLQWQKSFNPTKAFVRITPADNGFDFGISYSEECHACLICARHCPYGALEIEKEGESGHGN